VDNLVFGKNVCSIILNVSHKRSGFVVRKSHLTWTGWGFLFIKQNTG